MQVTALIVAAVGGFLLGVLLMALLFAGREEESLIERLETIEFGRRTPPAPDAGDRSTGAGGAEESKASVSSERIDG
jgi:hypothetical protein